jgi:hypothetical protein
MRKLTAEEISRRVKYSVLEEKYLVFAEDGTTVIGRSFIRATGEQLLKAYHKARAALARKGQASESNFKSMVHGDVPLVPDGISGGQRDAFDETDGVRRKEKFSDDGVIIRPPKDYPIH